MIVWPHWIVRSVRQLVTDCLVISSDKKFRHNSVSIRCLSKARLSENDCDSFTRIIQGGDFLSRASRKPVTDTAHGQDVVRASGILLQFSTQSQDEIVH